VELSRGIWIAGSAAENHRWHKAYDAHLVGRIEQIVDEWDQGQIKATVAKIFKDSDSPRPDRLRGAGSICVNDVASLR